MPEAAYQRQTFNTPNPIARYAHRSRLRRSIGYADEMLCPNGCLLDFGCGTGDFLQAFRAIRSDANLFGFEPYLSPGAEAFTRVGNMADVEAGSVDVITCMEVLEHLADDDLSMFVAQSRRVLRSTGSILVSVPIMGGLTLFMKEINRVFLFRRKSDYSLKEILKASFGGKVERSANRLGSHKGFDFRELRQILRDDFVIAAEATCPFSVLPWWLNSQDFLFLRHKQDAEVRQQCI